MNTLEFLTHILPEGDHYFIVDVHPKANGKRGRADHYHASSIQEAARKVIWRDAATTDLNTYYAMASFREESYVNTKGVTQKRTQDNAARLKCFWVDLDVKGNNDGTDYPTQIDAAKDIKRFCEAVSLPLPTFINSGYGVHAYWVLDASITTDEWTVVAHRFKNTLNKHGVRHDSSCTTDSARILRVPGTHNKKSGEVDREVKLTGPVRPVISLKTFSGALSTELTTGFSGVSSFGFTGADMTMNIEGEAAVEYRPSSVLEIVKECSLLREIGKVKGNVGYGTWFATLGLVKHTIEGAKAIHVFSSGHPEYSPDVTKEKADSWSHGATTCETLARDCSSDMKSHCDKCAHRGIIKSPIVLGYPKVMLSETVTVVVDNQLVETVIDVPALPPSMQHKFKWEADKLWKSVLDKEATKDSGQPTYAWEAFCETYFYPFSYYDDEDQKHRMVWRLREREGIYREFVLSGGAMGAGGQALFKELGEQSVIAMTGGKNHMEAYISNFASDVKKRTPNTATLTNFGWNGDDFLIGETLIKKGGELKKARLGGGAEALMKKGYFLPNGTVERWAELTDRFYNYPNQEQFQFILCTGFGSPLLRLMNCDGGTTVSAISSGSGIGKSTAGKLATGIYGNGRSGALTLTLAQATQKAVHAMAGTLNGIPIMLDEMTNVDPLVASEIIYTHSQGSGRIGLYNNGSLNLGRHNWSSIMNMSANNSVASLIQSIKPGADAEQARMIEFVISDSSKLSKEEADLIIDELLDIRCVVGLKFITWVQQNRDEVKRRLVKMQVELDKRLNLTKRDRYWSYAVAAVMTGAVIAKELGMIKFNLGNIVKWLETKVLEIRCESEETTSSPAQLFSSMLTTLDPGFIVTDIEGDRRGAKPVLPVILREPRGAATGRVIINEGKIYLPQPMLHKWCTERQVSMKDLIKEMVKIGWVLNGGAPTVKFPGKGTFINMGQFRCYTVDISRMEGSTDAIPDFSRVVSIFKKEGVA